MLRAFFYVGGIGVQPVGPRICRLEEKKDYPISLTYWIAP